MSGKSLNHFFVYIPDEECHGIATSIGAFMSLVKYSKNGMEYEVFMLNEDIIFLEDIRIGIEEEEI